jgi:hypothetical protein
LVQAEPALTAAEDVTAVLTDRVNAAIASMEIRSADFLFLIIAPFIS